MLGRTPPKAWGGRGYTSKVLDSILEEQDPTLLVHDLQVHARDLEASGNFPSATQVWALSLEKSQHSSIPKRFHSRAHQALQDLQGQGKLGEQLERGMTQVIRGAMDPCLWLAFGLGSTAYRAARMGSLLRFLKVRSPAPWIKASLIGLAAESATFLAVEKMGHGLTLENRENPVKSLGREYLSTAMSLGLLKAMGFLVGRIFDKVHGIDPLTHSVTSLGTFSQMSRTALHQSGMVAGLMASHQAQITMGWAPPETWSQMFFGALTSLFQLNLAGAASHALMGGRWRQMNQNLEMKSHWLYQTHQVSRGHFGQAQKLIPATTLGSWPLIWMSSQGKDPPGGKVIPFPKSLPFLKTPPIQSDPKLSWERAHNRAVRTRDNCEEHRNQLQTTFYEALSALELWSRSVRHRRKNPEFIEDIRLKFWNHWKVLLRLFDQVRSLRESLREYSSNLGNQDPFLLEHLEDLSQEYLVLGSLREGIRAHQGTIRKSLNTFNPQSLTSALDALKENYYRVFKERYPTVFRESFELNRHNGRYEGLEGMLLGVGLKDLWRELGKLPPNSQRRHDRHTQFRLFNYLEELGLARANLLDRLTEVHPLGPDKQPRVLRYHTDPLNPMMGWTGIFLPALLARFGGNFQKTWDRLKPFSPHVERELWQWTPVALYVLARASQGSGDPLSWFKDIPHALKGSPVHKILGTNLEEIQPETWAKGEAVAIPWALKAFIKHPYELDRAMDLALQSPETSREDTMALTGALLGAFHGPRFFSISRLEEFTNLPNRKLLNWTLENDHASEFISKLHSNQLNDNVILLSPNPISHVPIQRSFHEVKNKYQSEIAKDFKVFLPLCVSFLRRAANTGVTLREMEQYFRISRMLKQKLDQAQEHIKNLDQGNNIRPIREGLNENIPQRTGYLSLNLLGMAKDYLDSLDSHLGKTLWSGTRMELIPGNLEELAKYLRMLNTLFNLNVPVELKEEGSKPLGKLDVQRIYTASLLGTFTHEKREGKDWGQSMQRDGQQHNYMLKEFEREKSHKFNWVSFFSIGADLNKAASIDTSLSQLSRLLRVHLPIYLNLRQDSLKEIFSELEELPLDLAPEPLEAWRSVTYLSARLLRGAEPNLDLLLDLKESFDPPRGEKPKNDLELFIRTRESNIKNLSNLIRFWMESPDLKPSQLVTLGIYPLTLHPQEPHLAVQAAWEMPTEFPSHANMVLTQITSILAEARRQYRPPE